MGKAWNTTDFPNPVGRFTKTSLFNSKTSRKASSWCLLRLSTVYQTQKLRTLSCFSELILRYFLTRICESFTHDFCVLPLRICEVKCNWFIRADVTEIVLVARVRRRYFRRNQWQPEIRLRSQATPVLLLFIFNILHFLVISISLSGRLQKNLHDCEYWQFFRALHT